MVGVQEGVGSYVPGFTFNLGFSESLFCLCQGEGCGLQWVG